MVTFDASWKEGQEPEIPKCQACARLRCERDELRALLRELWESSAIDFFADDGSDLIARFEAALAEGGDTARGTDITPQYEGSE